MIKIIKYIGTYTIFYEQDLSTNKPSKNESDNYLLGKSDSQCYRYDSNKLCLYFPKGLSTTNVVLPKFDELGIEYKIHIDCEEKVYLINESDIHKVHEVLKFKIVGKNQQLKDYKLKLKQDKLNKNNKT